MIRANLTLTTSPPLYANAMAENFFGILKAEFLRQCKQQSIQEAQLLIDDFIFFYNKFKTKLTPLELWRQFT